MKINSWLQSYTTKEYKHHCNKCQRAIEYKDLNDNEIEEIETNFKNEGVPTFVCSDCINAEMEDEDLRTYQVKQLNLENENNGN